MANGHAFFEDISSEVGHTLTLVKITNDKSSMWEHAKIL